MKKVKWGILGAASIAVRRVIPGMQKGAYSEIAAIASRDKKKAEEAARKLGIPKVHGSYEELLQDREIEAIYNPLPNHLHVPWSIKAAEAGKHVLCEKPISITVAEAKTLLAARDRTGVKIGEAFMVKTHPQWLRTQEIIRSGGIGELRAIAGLFSYFNRDPGNVRHKVEWGGGGLLDIGCYPITMSRFIFAEEPVRVAGVLERDPDFKTDRLASAILEFPSGQSIFTCGTQTAFFQRMHFLGTSGRVEIEIPGMSSPARCVANVTFRCRSKTPSRIWRSSRRYSRQRGQGGGKDRRRINCKLCAGNKASAVGSEVEIETISVTMVTLSVRT